MEIAALAVALDTILNSGVVDKASDLINTYKNNKDNDKLIQIYETIFNDLIDENTKLKNISMNYRNEINQIYLSDQDIKYLQETATRVLNLFLPENEPENSQSRDDILKFIELIQVDTLRTMQLLGFNYREAIGKPLTDLVANSIQNYLSVQNNLEQ